MRDVLPLFSLLGLLSACQGADKPEGGGGDTDDGCGPLVDRYPDGDGDGYGVGASEAVCADDPAFADRGGDCDDDNAAVHPGLDEACNGLDDDCDGLVDNGPGAGKTWYLDGDGDGYGSPGSDVVLCGSTEGYASNDLDCDDGDGAVNPDAEEICGDDDDDDCDGLPDVGEVGVWYDDSDGDGFGYIGLSESTCEPPAGWVQDNSDCQPTDGSIYPGAEELCNDLDDDCDGAVDEDMDADGDGFRPLFCPDGTDCDDGDPDVFPGGAETCEDGVDNDCDGLDQPCGFFGSYTASTDANLHTYSNKANYYLGLLVEVGDATGDGMPDVIGTTLYADGYAGGGILIPGPVSGVDAAQNLGYRLRGSSTSSYGVGRSIGVGDVDGDGIDDLNFGSPYSGIGGSYLALGPITADYDLTSPDARLTCTSGVYCGHGGDLGDLTGDGIADVVIGSWGDASAGYASGAAYVLAGPITGDDSLTSSANKISGVTAYDYTGRYVFVGGDVNGDGLGEVLVAAPYATGASGRYSGIVYLVYGPASISDFGSADARLLGAGPSAYLGEGAPMGIGDLDGDGYGDVAVGGYTTSSGSSAGTAWAQFGPVSGDLDLHSADIVIEGSTGSQHMGSGVSIGDINSDGVGELLVGASGDSSLVYAGGAGYLYLSVTAGTYTPADADASFLGDVRGAGMGSSVVLKDMNGDGDGDVVLGAPSDTTAASAGGGIFIFHSQR